jgi:hypothetical protein
LSAATIYLTITVKVGRVKGKEAASQEGQMKESRCEKDEHVSDARIAVEPVFVLIIVKALPGKPDGCHD